MRQYIWARFKRISLEKQTLAGIGIASILGFAICLTFGYSIRDYIKLSKKVKDNQEIIEQVQKDKYFLLLVIVLDAAQIALFCFFARKGLSRIKEKNRELIALNGELQLEKEAVSKCNLIQSAVIRTASHELRTPLASMLTAIELLEYHYTTWDDQKRSRYFNQVKKNINYLVKLIENILVLDKLETENIVDLALLEVNQFCQDLIEVARDNKLVTQNIDFNSNSDSITLPMDENLTRQALINLISNAIKYSRPNSLIQVKTQVSDTSVTISVTDTGIGIPATELEQLFAPFYRASNAFSLPGSGIGLAIVKSSVERQGGRVEVESVVDVGTVFRLIFPIPSSNP